MSFKIERVFWKKVIFKQNFKDYLKDYEIDLKLKEYFGKNLIHLCDMLCDTV